MKKFTKKYTDILRECWGSCCLQELSEAFDMPEGLIMDKAVEIGLHQPTPQVVYPPEGIANAFSEPIILKP